jgi:hypothetical protein
MKKYTLLINGKWKESKDRREIKSPYDQSPVGKVHFAGKEETEEAIAAAHEAFSETKKLSSHERSQVLEKISSEIENRKEELARSITLRKNGQHVQNCFRRSQKNRWRNHPSGLERSNEGEVGPCETIPHRCYKRHFTLQFSPQSRRPQGCTGLCFRELSCPETCLSGLHHIASSRKNHQRN